MQDTILILSECRSKNPLNSLHCLSAASLQAVGFLAGMSFRIIRVRNRERIFLLFLIIREGSHGILRAKALRMATWDIHNDDTNRGIHSNDKFVR